MSVSTGREVLKVDGEVLVCLVSAPCDDADRIAETLVERGLAACCNVIDSVTSYFRWEGKLEKDKEALIIIKTTRTASSQLVSLVEEIHPYDLPEVILMQVTDGLEGYLRWVVKECSH
jgi:periplasmic divalent cation tolerance protein